MRYIIEIKTKKADEALSTFMQEQTSKNAEYIFSYDPKERLTQQVEKLGIALREYKASGISWDVFTTYLKGKGHSNKEINAVMGDIKDFFKKVGMTD